MEIKREVLTKLVEWKRSKTRKPLIIMGARQVGKTWLLKKFGNSYFDSVAYFNFDRQPELKQFFDNTKDPNRIIQNLSLVLGKPIIPGQTLIIFDEIQECNQALNSLKYFNEESPEYSIACAGSLLGVAMSRGASFPVGNVDFIRINPVSFTEFLYAADEKLGDYVNSIKSIEPLPDIFYSNLIEKFKMYYLSGGMPEAIVALLEAKDITLTQNVLMNIINAYTLDFSKHADNKDIPKIGYIWESIPSQLARENKKFLYRTVKPGARAREYEDALLWLTNAGLVHRVNRSEKPSLPVSAYDDLTAFKIYLCDVGLLRRLASLDPVAITEGNRLFTEFKGALTENYILESLINQFENHPRYWTSGNIAEVDFLLQYKNDIIPIEVKSDENIRSKSLSVYRKTFSPLTSIRYSLRNLKHEDGLINIPLFLADKTSDFLNLI
ncbi:MAG: ATPase [Bacteroidetes bacterium HGW-Bacteroidetes-7]|nr:MAG: ATPase [Bacteroidetes bacterium HGW-Bacteroidetes-7]